MNRTTPPASTQADDRADDLDRMFAAFFKAQLPKHWPQAPATNVEVARQATQSESHAGRLTLAASVACLLGLGLSLSYGTAFNGTPAPAGDLLKNSNADGKALQKHLNPENQPRLPNRLDK